MSNLNNWQGAYYHTRPENYPHYAPSVAGGIDVGFNSFPNYRANPVVNNPMVNNPLVNNPMVNNSMVSSSMAGGIDAGFNNFPGYRPNPTFRNLYGLLPYVSGNFLSPQNAGGSSVAGNATGIAGGVSTRTNNNSMRNALNFGPVNNTNTSLAGGIDANVNNSLAANTTANAVSTTTPAFGIRPEGGINTDFQRTLLPNPDEPGFFGEMTGAQKVNFGLGIAGGLLSGYMGLRQLSMSKDALNFQKEAFNKNYGNQVASTNRQLEDRQRTRAAANSNAESVESYMARNRVS